MLAKGLKGVNGKCVLVCTKLEIQWTKVAHLTNGHYCVSWWVIDNWLIWQTLRIGELAPETCTEIAY
jgi:hypothetical protein